MISEIEGKLKSLGDNYVDVSIGGVTFRIHIPTGLIPDNVAIADPVSLSTSLQIRQDSLSVYGFSSGNMRDFFETLITINSVGPRLALAILSIFDGDTLHTVVETEDSDSLIRVPGVGKRTANRIILELKGKIEQIAPDIQRLAPDDDVFNSLTALGYSIQEAREAIRSIPEEITNTELEIKEAKKWNEKYKKLGDCYTWLKEFFIPTVAEIEKQVLISIQQNFNETYRKWFRVLIDDPSKESRIDEHFTPIVEQDGYEQNVYYLSGGEITSVSLAYRLTLNMTMRQETESMNSNLLILDEPTDGFSKNQLSKVKDVLREMNSEQIILVSHEAELETYVDNVFQISKSEGYSRVTRMN